MADKHVAALAFLLISVPAAAEKPLHEWNYQKDDGGFSMSATEKNGLLLSVSCPKEWAETPEECALRIERAFLTPAVSCSPKDGKIACKIP